MDAVYPAGASALARGRRLRRGQQRARTRTQPVTFAEIKEVDEESSDTEAAAPLRVAGAEERRRRDELAAGAEWGEVGAGGAGGAGELPAPLARQFLESRRRRARKDVIPIITAIVFDHGVCNSSEISREPPEEGGLPRSSSEPRVHPAP